MNKMPLVEGLLKYTRKKGIRMHMPGHKAGRMLFKGISAKTLLSMDVTELDETDNLISPTGIIMETETKIAKTFGAYKSFLLTGGSTLGVISMMAAALGEGDEVVMDRFSHISAFSALAIVGAKPIYIRPKKIDGCDAFSGVTPDAVFKALKESKNAKAVFITSPNVFGICADVKKIADICKKYGVLLLVDEAHGAHFTFHKELPPTAMESGASMCTQSFHKTLPALTQSAVLHTANCEMADRANAAIRLFQSSSPSYLLMASMDSAEYNMKKYGKKRIGSLIKIIKRYAPDNFLQREDKDALRIVIKCDGYKSEKILRKYNIIPEMVTDGTVVCIISAATKNREVKRLLKIAANLPKAEKDMSLPPNQKTVITLREAYFKEYEAVSIDKAAGRTSKTNVYLYPPGIPILAAGEEITDEMLVFMQDIGAEKLTGLENGKIKVIK